MLGPRSGDELSSLVLDLPGSGATPAPPEPWGSEQYAELVAAAMDELAGRSDGGAGESVSTIELPATILGHSFGGRVALALASSRPDLVGALVLAGVPLLPRPGRPSRPSLKYRTVRALGRAGIVGDERLEKARQRYGSADYRRAQGVMRSVLVRTLAEDYADELALLRSRETPVELVWGAGDAEVPMQVAEALGEALPGARLTIVQGAGHLTPLEAPAEIRKAVERALA